MSGDPKLTPKFELSVDGSPVDAHVAEAVIVMRVRQHLEMANILELRLSNEDLSFSESDLFAEGKSVELKMGYEETSLELLIKAEVTRREFEFPMRGPAVATIIAHDKEHRLKRGAASKSFLDMKDSEIVSAVAQEVGLTADVDDSQVKHRYVLQNAKTGLEFIRDRAAAINYEVTVDKENSKISFKKPQPSETAAELTWGRNLLAFEVRMSAAGQVGKVTVRGWDMTKKEMIEGTADASMVTLGMNATETGADLAKQAFGERGALFVDRPAFEAAECTEMAKGIINQSAKDFARGRASCQGDTAIAPGVKVSCLGLGSRSSGEYYVEDVLHHLEPTVGYSTHFGFVRAGQTVEADPPPDPPDPLPPTEPVEASTWVEIELVADGGADITGTPYTLTLPDGRVIQGEVDETRKVRVDGITQPGDVKVELRLKEGQVSPGGE